MRHFYDAVNSRLSYAFCTRSADRLFQPPRSEGVGDRLLGYKYPLSSNRQPLALFLPYIVRNR